MPDRGGGLVPGDIRRSLENTLGGRCATWDGGGLPMFYEDWAHGLEGWTLTAFGTGAVLADLSVLQRRNGEFSLHMIGGNDTALGGAALKPLAFPALAPLGLEASFQIDANTSLIDLFISLATGANIIDFIARMNIATGQLQTWGPTAAFTNTPVGGAITLSTTAKLFHTMKLVVNPSTQKYVRCLVDSTLVDLTTAGAPVVNASATAPIMQVTLRMGSVATFNSVVFFADPIVTRNEVV